MHVVLAIDGSIESFSAAKLLCQLPIQKRTKLTILTVLVDSQFDLVTSEKGLLLREVENETAHANYRAAREIVGNSWTQIKHVVERGHPSRVILDVAERESAEVIVLGARGHSAVYRVVLGSTADFVANNAACSVLVVRPPIDTDQGDEELDVLLAYDGSPHSKEAFSQLHQFGWHASHTHIHIAMFLERPSMLPDDVVYDPDVMADAERSLSALKASWPLECELTYSVTETVHVASAIRHLATRKKSDLIVMGCTGKSAISRFFLGSASKYLLHHADCSIWIARQRKLDPSSGSTNPLLTS